MNKQHFGNINDQTTFNPSKMQKNHFSVFITVLNNMSDIIFNIENIFNSLTPDGTLTQHAAEQHYIVPYQRIQIGLLPSMPSMPLK